MGEEGEGLLAVHIKPVGADQVLLVEHRVVRAEEMEVLELKTGVLLAGGRWS